VGIVLFVPVSDPELRHQLALAIDAVDRGAADLAEIEATVARVPDGDHDAWVLEWMTTAGERWAAAHGAGNVAAARDHYLRAATYYGLALAAIGRSFEAERWRDVWHRQRACWDRAVECFSPPGVRLPVPYGDTTLPAYFFRATDAHPGETRPTVIVSHGGDGPTSQAWVLGGAAAAARGYHWLVVDGPGQQGALVVQGLVLRPDWEAVLTPVVNALLQRDDVDPTRLAVIGIGQAGYWIPRALAFEHRLAAAVVEPGVLDVAARWLGALPEAAHHAIRQGQRDEVRRELRTADLLAPGIEDELRRRGPAYGIDGDATAVLLDGLASYRLDDDLLARIVTPLLIVDAQDASFWPGQSQRLLDRLHGARTLSSVTGSVRSTHEPGVFDWLDAHLR
jgi:hypothetical protein